MDDNVLTGRKREGGLGSEYYGVVDAYGRDMRNDNGERLLGFGSNYDLAAVKTLDGLSDNGTSHTFKR